MRCSGCNRPYRVKDLLLQEVGPDVPPATSREGWTICRHCLWKHILGAGSPLHPSLNYAWEELLEDDVWSEP